MIKLSVPDVGNEEMEEIKKVIDSNYFVQGETVERFEKAVSGYLNVRHCIALSSGTAALHLALLSLGIKDGDEVIIPDFTFPATSNVVELAGAKVRLVDIKINDFCIDGNKIEECINEKTRAIMPVHEFGQCADMDKIMGLAKKYNLKVIEDAACALGAEHRSKKAGTIGNMGCFSFHPRKAVTTGEGGMVATDDDELAQRIRILRNHGIDYSTGKAEFKLPGFNYRMTEIQAAMGIAQIKKLENSIAYRRQMAEEYKKHLENHADIIIPKEKNYGRHIYQTYHILIDSRFNRDYLKEKLREKGIECNIGAYAVHEQKYYKQKYKYSSNMLKNSLLSYNQGLALPMHCKLDSDVVEFVCSSIRGLTK